MTSALSEAAPKTYPSFTSLRVGHSDLLKKFRSSSAPEIIQEIGQFIRSAQSAGALIDVEEEREAAQSLLDYWATILFRLGKEAPETTLAEFDPTLAPELEDNLCPYRGLNAFSEQDWAVFFGRQRLTEAIVTQLKSGHFVCVVGPSGSGKSSAVRAGLIPALKEGALEGSKDWEYLPIMVPGSKPLENLVHILRPSGAANRAWEQEQVQGLEKNPQFLSNLLSRSFQKPVVLIVDQFEETFTLCTDPVLQKSFVDNLLGVINSRDNPHIIILTMRSDFENKVALLPDFQTIFEKNLVRVFPLNAGELRSAVEEPANRIGLKFEEGVVDALLSDILGEPAALPLLQFTLLRLWESREHNRITWDSFRRLGGARQALARSADEFYSNLIPEEQVTARRILLRLVRPGEGLEITSNRVRREELYARAEARDRIDRVLGKFVNARLLKMTYGDLSIDDQVEVAHEALVRNWPTLVSWLEEERVSIRERQRLTTAAERWQSLNRDPSALIRGTILEAAKRYENLNELETAFLQASDKAQETEIARLRRRNQIITAFSAVALLLAIAAILLFFQSTYNAQRAQSANTQIARQIVTVEYANLLARVGQSNAETAQVEAQNQRVTAVALKDLAEQKQATAEAGSTQIAIQATEVSVKATAVATAQDYGNQQNALAVLRLGDQAAKISAEQPDLGLLLAVEASIKTPVSGEASQSRLASLGNLLDVLRAQPYLYTYLRGSQSAVTHLAYNLTSGHLVSSSADGTIQVWNTDQKSPVSSRLLSGFTEVNSVAFSARTGVFAAGGCAMYDRTGKCTSGLIRFTSLERQNAPEVNISAHFDSVTSVAFSPKDDLLASGGADGRVFVWLVPDLETTQTEFKQQYAFTGHDGPVTSVAYNQDGRLLASAGTDGKVLVRSIDTLQITASNIDPREPVYSLAFTPDGKYLAAGREDGSLIFLDILNDSLAIEMKQHATAIQAIAFSQDGRYMATGSKDGSVLLWDLLSLKQDNFLSQPLFIRLIGHTSGVSSLAFSPNGNFLASGSLDKTIILWYTQPPTPFEVASSSYQGRAEVPNINFSKNDTLTLVDENGLIQELDYLDGFNTGTRPWKQAIPPRQIDGDVNGAFFDNHGNFLGLQVQSGRSKRKILGFDVNDGLGVIDWQQIKNEGYSFVYARATSGASIKDSRFQDNWDGIQAAGLLRGAYHIFNPAENPEAQVKSFLDVVPFAAGNLPPVLEVLELGGGSSHQLLQGVQTWLSRVEEITGVRPILRISAKLWNKVTNSAIQQAGIPQLSQYPLWVVDYTVTESPAIPSGWSIWSFWQYSDQGRSTGIPKRFELSRYNGNENSLAKFIELKTASIPPLAEEDPSSSDSTSVVDLVTGKQIIAGIPVFDISCEALSPDGSLLAFGGKNGTISILAAANGDPAYADFSIGASAISKLAFSNSGLQLAASNEDGLVVIVNLKKDAIESTPFSGHTGKVSGLVFSPNDAILASGGTDGSIFLWDTQTLRAAGKPLIVPNNSRVTSLAFNAQGSLLAAALDSFEVILFDLNPDSIEYQACEIAGRNLTQEEWDQFFPGEVYRETCPGFSESSTRFGS